MAPRLSDSQLRNFIAEADRKGVANRLEFHRILNRGPGIRGISRLREAVEEWDPLVAVTKSNLESRFVVLRKEYGIPEPEVNVDVGEFNVDCFWRGPRVIVELDTYTYHGDTFSFEKDHSRDLILEGLGFKVVRITGMMLKKKEKLVMSTLQSHLKR